MDDLQAQVVEELGRITTYIEQTTGVSSNWNGLLNFVPVEAGFRGMKPFSCSIQLRVDLATRPTRWRTLIHEAFHAFSAGYNQSDFAQNVGWEEGVVEHLQRLFRPRILAALDVDVDESVFGLVEQTHPFNIYVEQLRRLQQALSADKEGFYLDLIAVPIKLRYQHLFAQAMTQRNYAALYVLSAARPIMESTNRNTIANNL